MNFISINPEKCIRCGLCVQSCPVVLIKQDKEERPVIEAADKDNCILCGHCTAVCPQDALDHSLLPRTDFLQAPPMEIRADALKDLLISRRSVRIYKKAPVPREQLEQLLQVCAHAPSASNSQKTEYSVITTENTLERIRELTLDWLRRNRSGSFYSKEADKGNDVILRGGTCLVVAHSPKDYAWNITDSTIALTYMELYAASMNLGVCWAGLVTIAGQNTPELNKVLGVPEDRITAGALILGRPKQKHFLVPPRNKAAVTWL
jgi:nitroreductase/NAD-dependent dihydropyrimidine dehydrogenase PreA subunit